MSPSESLVSIIIPAYNAARYLKETISSCVAQTHQNIEIIVVDDGSTDDTAQVMQSILADHPSIQYIHQTNAGPAAARNNGIRHAKGEFLQFLDADDVLLPTKLARSLEVFSEHPDTGLVYTNYEFRSEDLKTRIEDDTKQAKIVPQDAILDTLFNTGTTLFAVHCALTRADIARQVGDFDENVIVTEDWNFWVKVAATGTVFRYVNEILVWYRTAPQSLSKQDIRLSQMRLKAYEQLRGVDLAHITPDQLEQKIAARHHALAMVLWRHNQRAAARQQFQKAIQTHPHVRNLHRILWAMTYVFPADMAEKIVNGILKLRKR